MIVAGALVAWYAADLPDVEAALDATRRPSIRVMAADGSELATAGDLFGIPVQAHELPPAIPYAVLAIEDRRFYQHAGLDAWGLLRASVANLRAGAIVQGGSTITQQVAKNLFLTPERTLKRKVQELLLALWLERQFSKDQILALYLNRAYFGAGAWGVDAASRKYFGVPATRVSTYQAAMLAGLLRAPSRYNPRANRNLADGRARQVLISMVEAGFMTQAEADSAVRNRDALVFRDGPRTGSRWFVDWVLDQVPHFVSAEDEDLIVKTTLDPRLQRQAEVRMRAMLRGAGREAGASQAALVSLAPDGAVRAMVGGGDYRKSQFNRAVQARRQPGSAFKPFVYLAALEAGMTPHTPVVDAPLAIRGWKPRNFANRYRGEVTLDEALVQSINTVAVRLSEQVGRGRVIEVARRLGITADMPKTPSLALGVAEVSPLELTAAYAVFANGGVSVWPYAITTIHHTDGRLLYRRDGHGTGRVVAPKHAAAMTRMLSATVERGTGRAASLPRPVAGKTGTSENFRDAWFVGFSADLVTGVWMGNDDGTPMRKVTGGGLPTRLWRDYMADAHDGVPARSLPSLAYREPPAPVPPPAPPPATAASTPPESTAPPVAPSFMERILEAFPSGRG